MVVGSASCQLVRRRALPPLCSAHRDFRHRHGEEGGGSTVALQQPSNATFGLLPIPESFLLSLGFQSVQSGLQTGQKSVEDSRLLVLPTCGPAQHPVTRTA